MNLKKSIAIILSSVMVSNLACSYLASAKAPEAVECATEQVPEHVVVKHETPKVVVINAQKESEADKTKERKKLVDDFISRNAKYLPKSKIRDLSSKLQKLSDEDIYKLSSVSLHKPSNMTLISVFLGQLGIDRMMIGKYGTGILKFLTGGGFGIWWLIDIFKIGKLTKEQNWQNLKNEIKDL